MADLRDKKCVPCEGGVPKLEGEQLPPYLAKLNGWHVVDGKLRRTFELKDFLHAMSFLCAVAHVAEREGHHPDFAVHYNKVDFTIWTHAIDGLSENDFILAAKIDALA